MLNLNEYQLWIQHRRSFNNGRYVNVSKDCGCFNCLEHFDPSEITDWIEINNEKTALCPHCNRDTVIMETEHRFVEHDLLCLLKNAYCSYGTYGYETVASNDDIYEIFEEKLQKYREFEQRYYAKPWNR
jgi:hypothetical protein